MSKQSAARWLHRLEKEGLFVQQRPPSPDQIEEWLRELLALRDRVIELERDVELMGEVAKPVVREMMRFGALVREANP